MLKEEKTFLWTEINDIDSEKVAGGELVVKFKALHFPETEGRIGAASGTFVFNSNVNSAVPFIMGFDLFFTGNDDHELGRINLLPTDVDIDRNTVKVKYQGFIRDWSGNYDDPYAGQVLVGVIADVV